MIPRPIGIDLRPRGLIIPLRVSTSPLASLERIHRRYGEGEAERKLRLLKTLARARLPSAAAVHRLHEVLCFLRAYPDGPEILERVEAMLAAFDRRADLRRYADSLQDGGIAGTPIVYRFFFETARWLVRRWPERLRVVWDELEAPERLERALALFVLAAETPGLDELDLGLRAWVERLKGPIETDAAFLVRRFEALDADPLVRQFLYEDIGFWLRLSPGPDTPARTSAKIPRRRIHWQTIPLSRSRPDLLAKGSRPPLSVRSVSHAEGQRLIDVAREAMVTRSRDLDAFAYGSPDDVRRVDCGEGLELVAIGVVPERRLLLEAVYAFLTLKNGVPIGYVLNSALFRSAEIAYNVFDTYRGAEAAPIYGRVLALVRHLFGADTFTIFPYQLGDGNDEALSSGAWWFYQKLGFRPREEKVTKLMNRELGRMRRDPRHRSSIATLRLLSRKNLYLQTAGEQEDVIGILPLANVGLAVTDTVARRFGADRERAAEETSKEAMERLGVRSFRGFSRGERLSWRSWAPLVACLPEVERFDARERGALVEIIRAKGGRRESDFVRKFDEHFPLRRAIGRLAASVDVD
jgi:hypothetical protein